MAHNDGSLSYHLYDKLQEFVGTPNIVRIRRFFFTTLNHIMSSKTASVICSGSKAEGLNMPGSDLDVMFILKNVLVYNDISDIPQKGNGYYLDTQNTPAGFVQIKLRTNSKRIPHLGHVRTENGIVLENRIFRRTDIWKDHSIPTFIQDFGSLPHGPCVSTVTEDLDILRGMQCKFWPEVASDWVSRPRNWPPSYLISNIVQDKVVLAPIGSKFGSAVDNPGEWRLSFSVAEIMLVHSFNQTQLTCYAMLKLMLKEVIDKNPATEKLLCSYFVKTILFWLIEETGYDAWQQHKLIQCFRACFKRLCYFVNTEQCPNFFVPQNNMFEGKIYGSSTERLSVLLESLYADGINMFLHSKTLSKYLILVYESGMPRALTNDIISLRSKDVDKAIYPLLHHLHIFGGFDRSNNPFLLVTQENHTKLSKALKMLHLANICQKIGTETDYNCHTKNKQLYPQFRRHLCYLIIGTYSDAVSGWFLLASFFYRHTLYRNVVMIANFIVSSCLTSDSQIISEKLYPKGERTNIVCGSFLKRYRNVCVKILSVVMADKEHLFRDKDLETISIQGLMYSYGHSTPAVLAHFLLFMCYHKLMLWDRRQRALFRLQRSIEDVDLCSQMFMDDMIYLIKALKLANCAIPTHIYFKLQSALSYQLFTFKDFRTALLERMPDDTINKLCSGVSRCVNELFE